MSIFGWCLDGHHGECRREFEETFTDPKTNKRVSTGNTITCECRKRGCECYVPAKDRTKTKARRKK